MCNNPVTLFRCPSAVACEGWSLRKTKKKTESCFLSVFFGDLWVPPVTGGGRDSSRVQRGGAKRSVAIRYFVFPLPKPVVRRSNTEQIKKTPFCGVLLFATFRQAALWRRQRDSNPRGLSPKRFSRPPRCDRFDMPPC